MTPITDFIHHQMKMCRMMGYHCCYIAVDLHGTIFAPHKGKKNKDVLKYIPFAKEALQQLSKNEDIKIILFSSTYDENAQKYIDKLASDEIKIAYFNENPEVKSNEYADFSKKFYFDVLIDDKCGFTDEDWQEIYQYF